MEGLMDQVADLVNLFLIVLTVLMFGTIFLASSVFEPMWDKIYQFFTRNKK